MPLEQTKRKYNVTSKTLFCCLQLRSLFWDNSRLKNDLSNEITSWREHRQGTNCISLQRNDLNSTRVCLECVLDVLLMWAFDLVKNILVRRDLLWSHKHDFFLYRQIFSHKSEIWRLIRISDFLVRKVLYLHKAAAANCLCVGKKCYAVRKPPLLINKCILASLYFPSAWNLLFIWELCKGDTVYRVDKVSVISCIV